MTAKEERLYVKGAKIWIPHNELVWEGVSLLKDYKIGNTTLHIQNENGRQSEYAIKKNLPHLQNPSFLIGLNDLTSLSFLHEPAVVNNLEVRFKERQAIYTYCGIILVAINPYAELPLYGSDIIQAYRGHSMGELEPHIFAVAEEAYAKLERENGCLSIIVSGESGAGKTVSAKYAMRYFAAVGGSESETQVERKVLASSPIMEAFGNAKTTRNDNSSRFGKFTKLLFRNNMGVMNLTGAIMQTYLLEKSRVVFQSSGERNYHIFYQLCSASKDMPELVLDDYEKFKYLNFGRFTNTSKDEQEFKETLNALKTLDFKTPEINDIKKILAGILHLGNIQFNHMYKKNSEEIDQEACDILTNDMHLNIVSNVLQISSIDLRQWLICRQIESVNESVLIPNNIMAAETARDALAKHIYSKLFEYIVGVTNRTLNTDKNLKNFIGVLDIYGFETFEVNSFEQFCINYANEKLQQQFNQYVFKLEQEVYIREGIEWTIIDFYDNQPCIDLIETKLGVLDLLDEECRMPNGSDETWVVKLNEKCAKFKHFDKARFGTTSFLVKHFSAVVQYNVFGFLDKNRDAVSKELVNVIRKSKMDLCKELMNLEECDRLHNDDNSIASMGTNRLVKISAKPKINPSKQHKRTVGSQFRDSLKSLIGTLDSTTPHYVRCIKPNEDKMPFKWETQKIVQQLRACGVLETVRISAAGFPSRLVYDKFFSRYKLLCTMKELSNDIKTSCKNIVLKWIKDEDDKYRFGKTQLFFRFGQIAYLEQIRTDIRKKYIIIVQSIIKRFIYRRHYQRLLRTAIGIQTFSRGFLARKEAQRIRQTRAAITIQKNVRRWIYRRSYVKIRFVVLGMQKYARGMLARRKYQANVNNYRAIEIQRFCRGYLARLAYNRKINRIIKCQACIRRFLAKQLYKKIKAEAKTISHIQKMYKGLENKVFTLQQRIDELVSENKSLKVKNNEIPELKKQVEHKKKLDHELKALKSLMDERTISLETLTKELQTEKDEKLQLIAVKANDHKEWANQKKAWQKENEELKKQVDEVLEMSKAKEKQISTMPQSRILSEVDTNEIHQAYQQAVQDKELLETENSLLKQQICRITSSETIPSDNMLDEDFGYSSANNTLDVKNKINNNNTLIEAINEINTEPMKPNQLSLIVKLRNILEEEKTKNKSLVQQVTKMMVRHKATTDSLKVSDLEVENEKLRHDYAMLLKSVKDGVETRELQVQITALHEELSRRREECLQLRVVLQQQSQSLKIFSAVNSKDRDELMDAFESQKLVNRQLETELTAITEENNLRLADLSKQVDDLRMEKSNLEALFLDNIKDIEDEVSVDILKKNERYLRYELEKCIQDYTHIQQQLNESNKKAEYLLKVNKNLSSKLRNHGLNHSDEHSSDVNYMPVAKKKDKHFQGIFKYRRDDIEKICERLIEEFTPDIGLTLLPGYPAYIIFMCIRYTDVINSEEHVQELLTQYILKIKQFYRNPHSTETRILWLVNTLTLLNLLKQYGGIEEYIKLSSITQSQQQLNNFDLSQYRHLIQSRITNLYTVLVKQIQVAIKPNIVQAILIHDEMSRGRTQGKQDRSISLDMSPEKDSNLAEPKSLVNQLEHYYKQFKNFGLTQCYTEQIFNQLIYYICAVSMNGLMLRANLCMWKTGMKIRYNTGCLEQWVRNKKMTEEVLEPITPLLQVSELLQARKTEKDVDTIYELCSALSAAQALKVLKSYKTDDYEESRISSKFIDMLSNKFSENRKNTSSDSFTMDDQLLHPLKIVFQHSDIELEEIELPKVLNLDGLLEKI